MVSHPESDILEYEVKWALGSITTNKASGGDGTSVELFQILKDDAVKVLHSYANKSGKLSSGHMRGASGRTSTRGKGHEEGGSTYAKVGSSLRSLPGNF